MNSAMANHQVPGYALLKIEDDKMTYDYGGLRAFDKPEKIEAEDQWHIGSCSKSMSAYLIAVLVDKNLVHFDDSLQKLLPEVRHNNFKKVTILDLLSHTSGIPEVTEIKDQKVLNASGDSAQERSTIRNKLVEQILNGKPKFNAKEKFDYSNSNYVILGQIVERVTGLSWEDALVKNIFSPLSMSQCGFGPSTQISGHTIYKDKFSSVPKDGLNDLPSDNPTSIAAAGSVHCDMKSWGNFLQEMLDASNGHSKLLKAQTAQFIFSPYKDGVVHGGWGAKEKPWANGVAYTMVGSNELNYAMFVVAPKRNFIIAGAVNTGTDNGLQALNEALKELVK